MGLADRAYERLPLLAQHAAVTAFGAGWAWSRFGPGFRHELQGFISRSDWDADLWDHFRSERLRDVLRSAADDVPYYRGTWSPDERNSAIAGELSELPLLDKEPLRSDPWQFVNPLLRPRRPRVFHTSGSSGTPIASIWSTHELRASIAVREARSARWAGTSFRRPRATFSGRMVEPRPDSTGPFYRFNAVERQIYLSPFHLSRANAHAYVDAFRRHKIRWATGYAVSYFLLAGFILEEGIEPLNLDAVVTTSEKLTDPMRQRIGEAFGCRVYEEYSSVENAFFASECPMGSLHVSPDVGIVEILRADGSPAPSGEPGEVVVTSMLRRVQPMIRYRIGDVARWASTPCGCGRGMPILAEVEGRVEDVVVGPDGRQLVRFHGVFVGLTPVIEAQVIQDEVDRFRILVVGDAAFDEDVEAAMADRMRQRLGRVQVSIERVDRIPRSASGKFQAVISHVRS